jgi:hypothetical protein
MFSFPGRAQQNNPRETTVPNDQLIFAEQLVRAFFPRIGGHDAVIDIRVEVPISDSTVHTGAYSEPRAHRLSISVIDWCIPPRDPAVPHIGGTGRLGMPCTQFDKQYKRPLWGEIGFANRSGHIMPVEGFFQGTLFDDAPTCDKGKPRTRKELIERLHLDRLSVLLGRKTNVTKISQENGADWTALIQVGPRASRHSLYLFYLDECGSVTRFALEN